MNHKRILFTLVWFIWLSSVEAEHVESWRSELLGWCSPGIQEKKVAPICYGFLMATLDLLQDGHLIIQQKKHYPDWVCAKSQTHNVTIRQIRDLVVARGDGDLKHVIHNHSHDLVVDVMIEAGLVRGQVCDVRIADKQGRVRY